MVRKDNLVDSGFRLTRTCSVGWTGRILQLTEVCTMAEFEEVKVGELVQEQSRPLQSGAAEAFVTLTPSPPPDWISLFKIGRAHV